VLVACSLFSDQRKVHKIGSCQQGEKTKQFTKERIQDLVVSSARSCEEE
jgi:hypothetical protein